MTTPSDDSLLSGKTRRRWFAGLAALGGLGLLGAQAQAQGWGRRHPLDPEEMAHRLDWRIGRLIKDVGGTTDQKNRLVAIWTAAQADLQPLRDQLRQARRAGLQLLAAPVIDRRALEQQRVTQMQLADARSKRMVQAMADAAEVLTPEQRLKVAERMKRRMEHRLQG
ncbi:MAG TPA: Spy/CpxP family protein refolding chaperone [Ramlibacter sp.]|nr:Spy/CpxP family protein refolding chaperone [Ramlibacter sp.]